MTITEPEAVQFRMWPLMLVLGLVNFAIGVAVIVWPDITLTILAFLLGLQLLIFGAIRLLMAFSAKRGTEGRGLVFAGAILGIIVGLLVIREPLRAVEIIVILLGIYWVVIGVIGLIGSVLEQPGERARLFWEGLIAFAFGVVLLAWPEPTVLVLTWVIGLGLVAWGVVLVALAFTARSQGDV